MESPPAYFSFSLFFPPHRQKKRLSQLVPTSQAEFPRTPVSTTKLNRMAFAEDRRRGGRRWQRHTSSSCWDDALATEASKCMQPEPQSPYTVFSSDGGGLSPQAVAPVRCVLSRAYQVASRGRCSCSSCDSRDSSRPHCQRTMVRRQKMRRRCTRRCTQNMPILRSMY